MKLCIGEAVLTPGIGERCDGCDRPARPGEIFCSLRDEDGDLFGWFCPSCLKRWHETRAAAHWGLCAGCGQKRTLVAIDTGNSEGPAWLCEECRQKH